VIGVALGVLVIRLGCSILSPYNVALKEWRFLVSGGIDLASSVTYSNAHFAYSVNIPEYVFIFDGTIHNDRLCSIVNEGRVILTYRDRICADRPPRSSGNRNWPLPPRKYWCVLLVEWNHCKISTDHRSDCGTAAIIFLPDIYRQPICDWRAIDMAVEVCIVKAVERHPCAVRSGSSIGCLSQYFGRSRAILGGFNRAKKIGSLLLARPPHLISRPPERVRKSGDKNRSESSESRAIITEKTETALAIETESYDRLYDNITTFIKAVIGFCVLVILKASLKRLRARNDPYNKH
jgi:hypothetical protein